VFWGLGVAGDFLVSCDGSDVCCFWGGLGGIGFGGGGGGLCGIGFMGEGYVFFVVVGEVVEFCWGGGGGGGGGRKRGGGWEVCCFWGGGFLFGIFFHNGILPFHLLLFFLRPLSPTPISSVCYQRWKNENPS